MKQGLPLNLLSLKSHESEKFEAFYAIYSRSFPKSEQKSKPLLREMLESSSYTIFVVYEEALCTGFSIMFHPLHVDFYLLEYMAIDEKVRSKGIGSALLLQSIQRIYETYGEKPLLVEIDSPEEEAHDSEIRRKRERFYRKGGCLRVEPFSYILGLKSRLTPPQMELLVYHPTLTSLTKESLKQWLETIYTLVYDCEKDDERIAQMLSNVPPKLHLI